MQHALVRAFEFVLPSQIFTFLSGKKGKLEEQEIVLKKEVKWFAVWLVSQVHYLT